MRDSQERHASLTGDPKINADIAYGDGCKTGQKMTKAELGLNRDILKSIRQIKKKGGFDDLF